MDCLICKPGGCDECTKPFKLEDNGQSCNIESTSSSNSATIISEWMTIYCWILLDYFSFF